MPSYSFHAYSGGAQTAATTSPENMHQHKDISPSNKSHTAPATRPKSIAVMGTINESSTDSSGTSRRNTESHNYTTSLSTGEDDAIMRLSTPDLGGVNFSHAHMNSDLTGRVASAQSCGPEFTGSSNIGNSPSPQHTSPVLTQVIKRPLVRTSSKYIELGRKPTKSSFSNDISMYTPKSLSGYHPSSSSAQTKSREDYNNSPDVLDRTTGQLATESKVYVYSPKSYHLSPTSPVLQTGGQQYSNNNSPQVSSGGRAYKPNSSNTNRSPRGMRPKTNPYSMRQVSDALPGNKVLTSGNIQDALVSLRATLEDYQGQYPEIQKLEEQVHYLDRLLKVRQLFYLDWLLKIMTGVF